MKWLILAAALLFNSASPGPSDADKAFRDFERGDYSLALKGWTLLANRGDAEGRYFLGHMYAEGLERFPITRGHSRQQRNSFRIPLV
jgi:TPR repeat protein